MYLKDAEECEVLLRLIDDCDNLVHNKIIAADAAFNVISEAARHHSDHPGAKRRRLEEYRAKEGAVEPPAPQPEPVPEAIDAVNAF